MHSAQKFLARIEKILITANNRNIYISDPDKMRNILIHLGLNDFFTQDQDFSNFLKDIKTLQIDMGDFIEQVKSGLLSNKSICDLLAYIQEQELISDEEIKMASETLLLQINLLYLLEAFVVTMANSKTLAEDIYSHIVKRRNSYAPGNPIANFIFAPTSASLFERLKIISVDPAMLGFLFHRSMGDKHETSEALEAYINSHQLSGLNANIRVAQMDELSLGSIPPMAANIMEAGATDATRNLCEQGGIANAKVASTLIHAMEKNKYPSVFEFSETILPEDTHLTAEQSYSLIPHLKIDQTIKKVSKFKIEAEWRDIYIAWNLLFVIANIEDPIFVPLKLIIPSILKAQPENFTVARILSLFFVANTYLYEQTQHNEFFKNHYDFRNASIILTQFGNINKRYAQKMLDKLYPTTQITPDHLYYEIYGNYPILNLLKNLIGVARNPRTYRMTDTSDTIKAAPHSLFFSPPKEVIPEEPKHIKKEQIQIAENSKASSGY